MVRLQRFHIAGQRLQRLQAAQDGRAQCQRHHRQQPQARFSQLDGDIRRQIMPFFGLDQHHHLTALHRIPLGKAAPGAGRAAQLQIGKAVARIKRRQRRVTGTCQHMTCGIPHQNAERILVVVLFQAGQGRLGHVQIRLARQRGRILRKRWQIQRQQQRGGSGQMAVGQLVRFMHAGAVADHHKPGPHQQQRGQHAAHQAAGERSLPACGRFHGPSSRGMK